MKHRLGKTFKTGLSSARIALFLILIITACFALTACDPGHYQFTREKLSDVVNIELVDYDNPTQKHFFSWVPDHSSDLKPLDHSKMSVLETLNEEKYSDFIDDLCERDVLYLYYAYDSPKGICIKLSYSNGDYLIIWSNYQNDSFSGYIGKFYADGKVAEFIGSFPSLNSYTALVNDYFETQL